MTKLTIRQLAENIEAELAGQAGNFDHYITAVSPADAAGENDITFLAGDKYKKAICNSRAAAVIVSSRQDEIAQPQLIVKNVNAALIKVLTIFAPKLKVSSEGIDASAKVAADVKIAESVSIGAGVVIEDGVEIGENTVIAAGCKIGQNSRIGSNCRLDCNVIIYHNCVLGNNVIIQANSTIGATGFGYSFIDGAHRLIPHIGGVIIEDFVELGANCCVDRAKFANTIIGAGTKIDNLVQIAHNVIIGKCCLIASQTGISGSTELGDGIVIGGQVGLADNIKIGSGTMIGAQAGVMNDVGPGRRIMGTPAYDGAEALRLVALTKRLPKIVDDLKQINKRLEKLETTEDHKA